VFIGFADAFIYLRDNKRFDEEVHKILARTVSSTSLSCVTLKRNSFRWPHTIQLGLPNCRQSEQRIPCF
jgi:hypothetical protein